MTDTTRRGFLNVAGASAAALGIAAALPASRAAGTTLKTAKIPDIGDATGPMVAYIKDVSSSAISLMVGDREVILHDKDIVARLVHATR